MTNSILQVKEVHFQGDTLIGIQTDAGIYTAVNRACQCIGLTDGQKRRQVENITEDLVLKQGVANLRIPTNGGNQEVLCILITFLPLWLAKISITPTMKKNNPKLVEKLIAYQLKAKDVLAAAFLPQHNEIKPAPQNCNILNHTIQTLQQTQQTLTECSIAYGYTLQDHEVRITQSEETIPLLQLMQDTTIDCLSKQGNMLLEHEDLITKHGECLADLNQFKQEVKAEIKQMELLTKEDQELEGVNLIPKLAVQDVVKLNYQEFASKVHSLVIDLSSKRKEVAGNTYKYLYNLLYSNRENWHDMAEAVSKQGLMGFNIENTKLIYEHLPLRKTYVKTLLAALYN